MIYVLKSEGKGPNTGADFVTLLTFLSVGEAEKHIDAKTQKSCHGHKYWTRFDIVEPGERIEPFAE